MEVKINEIFYPQIQMDRESYAITSGWVVSVLNQSTDTVTSAVATVTEAIKTIASPRTAYVLQDASAGDIEIIISSGSSTMQKGDVFSDPIGNVYYVDAIDINKITLREALRDPISNGSTLTQVGNTAVYSCGMSIGAVGKYSVIMQNQTIGASYSLPYTVKAHDTEDVLTAVGGVSSQVTSVEGKTDSLTTTLGQVKTTVEAIASSASHQAFV